MRIFRSKSVRRGDYLAARHGKEVNDHEQNTGEGKKVDHVPLPMRDEEESDSETSFGDEHNGLLDRLGMKVDLSLQKIFTG